MRNEAGGRVVAAIRGLAAVALLAVPLRAQQPGIRWTEAEAVAPSGWFDLSAMTRRSPAPPRVTQGGPGAYSKRDADLLMSPATASEKVFRVVPSSRLTVMKTEGGFTQVRTTSGEVGWISTSDLSRDAPPAAASVSAAPAAHLDDPAMRVGSSVAATKVLELRSRADAASSAGPRISAGSRVSIIASQGDWLQVRSDDGSTGWISSSDARAMERMVPTTTSTTPSR